MEWFTQTNFEGFQYVLQTLYEDEFFLYKWRNKGITVVTSVRERCPTLRTAAPGSTRTTWPSCLELKRNLFFEYSDHLNVGDLVHTQRFVCSTCSNCSAKWKVIHRYPNNVLVLRKGKHTKSPDQSNVKLDNEIQKKIKEGIGSKKHARQINREINQHIEKELSDLPKGAITTNTHEISRKKAYYNWRVRRNGDLWRRVQITVENLQRKGVLITDQSIPNFVHSDFREVQFRPSILEYFSKNNDGIIGLDLYYKSNIDRQPIIVITFVTKFLSALPLYIGVMNNSKSSNIHQILVLISNHLKKSFNVKLQNFVFMIDNDCAIIKALEELNYEYILCKFHLVKAWNAQVDSLPPNIKKKTWRILLKMYNSSDETTFDDLYSDLKKLDERFLDYFDKYYLHNVQHWTSRKRESRFGLWNTNNYTESFIKSLQNWCNNKKQSLDAVIESIDSKLTDSSKELETRSIGGRKKKNVLFKETEKILKEALETFQTEDEETFLENGKENEENLFNVSSFTGQEITYKVQMAPNFTCECDAFVYTGRPCKHIYFVALHDPIVKADLKRVKENPFTLLSMVSKTTIVTEGQPLISPRHVNCNKRGRPRKKRSQPDESMCNADIEEEILSVQGREDIAIRTNQNCLSIENCSSELLDKFRDTVEESLMEPARKRRNETLGEVSGVRWSKKKAYLQRSNGQKWVHLYPSYLQKVISYLDFIKAKTTHTQEE